MPGQLENQLVLQQRIAFLRAQAAINSGKQIKVLMRAAVVMMMRQGAATQMACVHRVIP